MATFPEVTEFNRPGRGDIKYVIDMEEESILDGQDWSVIMEGVSNPLDWLAKSGALRDGGAILLFGEHPKWNLFPDERLEAPIHIVGGAGTRLQGFKLGGESCDEIHFWGVTFANRAHSYSPIETEDQKKRNPVIHGLIGIHGCGFEGAPGAYIWKGRFPAKWWINGKGAASWYIDGCRFPAVMEHAGYLHYAQECVIRNCWVGESGGTAFQFASRAGRPDSDKGEYYYGNPHYPAAGSEGPLVIQDVRHDDLDANFRDASSIACYGWVNDIHVSGLTVAGDAPGAIVLAPDTFKGAHLTNGETWSSDMPGDPPADARVFGNIYIDELNVYSGEHNRGIVMADGFESLHVGSFKMETGKPCFLVDTQGSCGMQHGPFQFHLPGHDLSSYRGFDRATGIKVGSWNGQKYERWEDSRIDALNQQTTIYQ